MILAIKTDNPTAEFYLANDNEVIDSIIWQADRKLADNIHTKIKELLNRNNLDWKDIGGLIVYKGPGSFTGLRIGISVFNVLAYSLPAPIIGTMGEVWLSEGLDKLEKGKDDKIVLPEYGNEPNITTPKK